MAFIFDTEKGETPRSIALKRELAARIAGGIGGRASARNVGEGIGNALTSLGQGFAARGYNKAADEGERAGMASAEAAWNPILSAISGGQQNVPLETLLGAVSNPFLGEGQRAALGSLMERNFDANDPMRALDMDLRRAQIAKLQSEAAGGGGGPKFGMQPVFLRGSDGTVAVGQLTSDGQLVPSQTPEGFVPMGPGDKAFDTQSGKLRAETVATLPTDLANAAKTIRQIDELTQHEGLPSIIGQVDQFRPSWTLGDAGNDALARLNQLQGGAFLEAYGMLKGGGQITEVEGIKAEQAMARLSRAQGEAEFKKALGDFRDAVASGMEKMRAAAGTNGHAQAVPGEVPTMDDAGWQTLSNGVKFRMLP